MNRELKPCPFCGGKAKLTSNTAEKWHWGECENCGAEGDSDLGVSGAIENWNTRPLETSLIAEVERLRAEHRAGNNHAIETSRMIEDAWTEIKLLKAEAETDKAAISMFMDREIQLTEERDKLRAELEAAKKRTADLEKWNAERNERALHK